MSLDPGGYHKLVPLSAAPQHDDRLDRTVVHATELVLLMIYIPQYLKDTKLWELRNIPYYGKIQDLYHQPYGSCCRVCKRSYRRGLLNGFLYGCSISA